MFYLSTWWDENQRWERALKFVAVLRLIYHFRWQFHTGGVGGSHIDIVYICACLLGCYFAKFVIAIGGFSSGMKEPKLHTLGVFCVNYGRKHPICANLGDFLSKMVYWWVGNCAKKIGIEKVQFSRCGRYMHVQFWRKYPLRGSILYFGKSVVQIKYP